MNDRVADAENASLTQEEARQVLRLSPEGLRRLADLDEAIIELRAARRSLLANRLESIRDAFAAARNGSSENGDGHQTEQQGGRPGMRETVEPDAEVSSMSVGPVPAGSSMSSGSSYGNGASGPLTERVGRPAADGSATVPGSSDASTPNAATSLETEVRMLRSEVAELRRQVASAGGAGSSDSQLQQIHRRLSYVEAELESRHH